MDNDNENVKSEDWKDWRNRMTPRLQMIMALAMKAAHGTGKDYIGLDEIEAGIASYRSSEGRSGEPTEYNWHMHINCIGLAKLAENTKRTDTKLLRLLASTIRWQHAVIEHLKKD